MASIDAPALRRGGSQALGRPGRYLARAPLAWAAVAAVALLAGSAALALNAEAAWAVALAAIALLIPTAVAALGAVAGLGALRAAIHRANDGSLDPVTLPAAARPIASSLAAEYDALVHNLGSLFQDMERAQLGIIAERNRHEAVLLGLPGALLVIDGDLRVNLSNRQAEVLFGRNGTELDGAALFDLLRVGEEDRNVLRDALLQERNVSNKVLTLQLGDTVRQVSLNLTFFTEVPEEAQASAAIILQDITEWKHLEDVARQAEKYAAMGQIAGGVAHELNTPLGTILGYAKLLGEAALPETKRVEYAQVIHGETRRCAGIIDDLLAYARHDQQHADACDVNGLVREVAEAVSHCQGRRYCVPVEARAEGGELRVKGGPGQLDIVLVNLLVNAVQAAAGGTSPQVCIDTSVKDGYATIAVSDNGPGVPVEVRHRIFEPFFTTKASGEGTGLGLPMCQSIVSRIGGRIELDTAHAPGARFVVTLPLAVPAA